MSQERRQGHSALLVKDGKIEKFDPNPGTAPRSTVWLVFENDYEGSFMHGGVFTKKEHAVEFAKRTVRGYWTAEEYVVDGKPDAIAGVDGQGEQVNGEWAEEKQS